MSATLTEAELADLERDLQGASDDTVYMLRAGEARRLISEVRRAREQVKAVRDALDLRKQVGSG